MSTSPEVKPMKLFYFNITGNGEPIRLIAAQGKLLDKFEDVRVTSGWPELKTSGKLAFEQLPALQVGDDEEMIVQTSAIIRYLGRVSGLYPTDLIQAARVDAILQHNDDMGVINNCSKYQERLGYEALGGEEGETTKAVRAALETRVFPRFLGFLEKMLEKSSTGWLANTPEPTVADFPIALRVKGMPEAVTAQFPKLLKHAEDVLALESVKAWYAAKEEEKVAAAAVAN